MIATADTRRPALEDLTAVMLTMDFEALLQGEEWTVLVKIIKRPQTPLRDIRRPGIVGVIVAFSSTI